MPHIPRLVLPNGGKVHHQADVKGLDSQSPVPSEDWDIDLDYDFNPEYSPVSTGSPRPGSSCYALRAAVANLAFWDDFEAEKIGSGFFADVYKIKHNGNGNVLVVKISKSNNSRVNQQKMLQELELLNKLKHPNVVRYMGACVKDGHIHPLLEYVNGGSLEDVLKDEAVSLSWQQKACLATDIARGMEYLHSKNVCHRDLKSENCLIRRSTEDSFEAVVADFGLARVVELDDDPEDDDEVDAGRPQQESPRRMSLVGSPFWMAPEILRGEEYTKTVDVFSFGIILCEIMARISADPDDLPRKNNFGLDIDGFRELCPSGCPEYMLQLAADCCSMIPTNRPSFTEIYHRLCHINHLLNTPEGTASVETRTQDKNPTENLENQQTADCNCTQHKTELTDSPCEIVKPDVKQTKCYANENTQLDESTTHECTSGVQNLALAKLKNTSRIQRALYTISAAVLLIVLVTLVTFSVISYRYPLYILFLILVPSTLFILCPISMQKWWRDNHFSLRVSNIFSNLGRRLSWNNSTNGDIADYDNVNRCQADQKSHPNGKVLIQPSANVKDNELTPEIDTVDPKHDIYTENGHPLPDHTPIGLNNRSCADFASNLPKTMLTRRRLSKTLYRSGSFSLPDSIEEHENETRAS